VRYFAWGRRNLHVSDAEFLVDVTTPIRIAVTVGELMTLKSLDRMVCRFDAAGGYRSGAGKGASCADGGRADLDPGSALLRTGVRDQARHLSWADRLTHRRGLSVCGL
jgi:hypothetical protein